MGIVALILLWTSNSQVPISCFGWADPRYATKYKNAVNIIFYNIPFKIDLISFQRDFLTDKLMLLELLKI